MIRFDVFADGDKPLLIQFEPEINRIVLEPGDKITVEWPDWDGRVRAAFLVADGKLIISEPSWHIGSEAKVWNSDGEQITW